MARIPCEIRQAPALICAPNCLRRPRQLQDVERSCFVSSSADGQPTAASTSEDALYGPGLAGISTGAGQAGRCTESR